MIAFGILGFGVSYLIWGRWIDGYLSLETIFLQEENEFAQSFKMMAGVAIIRNSIIGWTVGGIMIGLIIGLLTPERKLSKSPSTIYGLQTLQGWQPYLGQK